MFIESITIIDNGDPGFQGIGDSYLNPNNPYLFAMANMMPASGRVYLEGGSVAKGSEGAEYLQEMANKLQRKVSGWTGTT